MGFEHQGETAMASGRAAVRRRRKADSFASSRGRRHAARSFAALLAGTMPAAAEEVMIGRDVALAQFMDRAAAEISGAG